MTRRVTVLFAILGLSAFVRATDNPAKGASLRLMLTETAPGTMASQQYCMLVFSDRTFHAEHANRKLGKDRDRRVYEGQLSETDWNALGAILDAKEFVNMKVSRAAAPLMIENSHPYTISVAREKTYQNMEFLTDDSIKPYQNQVKPLLQWWKSIRDSHKTESKALVDDRCLPNSNNSVYSY